MSAVSKSLRIDYRVVDDEGICSERWWRRPLEMHWLDARDKDPLGTLEVILIRDQEE